MNLDQARQYRYSRIFLADEKEQGYEAVIPKFPHLYIFADSLEELDQVVRIAIAEEIQAYEKKGKPIPKPDVRPRSDYSGKFLLRIEPHLHERLSHLAMAAQCSLNEYVKGILHERLGEPT